MTLTKHHYKNVSIAHTGMDDDSSAVGIHNPIKVTVRLRQATTAENDLTKSGRVESDGNDPIVEIGTNDLSAKAYFNAEMAVCGLPRALII